MQGMDKSKGAQVEGTSSPQLELLKDVGGAFRPSILSCEWSKILKHTLRNDAVAMLFLRQPHSFHDKLNIMCWFITPSCARLVLFDPTCCMQPYVMRLLAIYLHRRDKQQDR